MRADEQAGFLTALAEDLAADDAPDEVVAGLREVAKSVAEGAPEIQVVEQRTALKTGGAPDGWSWSDVKLTGYYSGIRLQRGEPIIEQDGHLLILRQGEVSFSERQVPIYKLLSGCMYQQDGTGPLRHNVTVFVVQGFQGERTAIHPFRMGEQLPSIWLTGENALTEAILAWLKEAHDSPVIRREVKRTPPMERLPLG